MALETAKAMQRSRMNNSVIYGLDMMMGVLSEFSNLFNAFNPALTMDHYCRGLYFGLVGSKIMVKVANTVLNNQKSKDKFNSTGGGGFNLGDLMQKGAM